MELTKLCKSEFEKWYEEFDYYTDHSNFIGLSSSLRMFYKLPESMRYSVYVDYADSVGVDISIWKDKTDFKGFVVFINRSDKGKDMLKQTRPEARTQAIKKLDEIRNEQLKR